ncbi:MAG: hypothetical protein DRP87_01985 [Spirochaetes bacterium]|nr:MAG: hypothetical protein DRP87_01985 [Spirochaetota bacterium]
MEYDLYFKLLNLKPDASLSEVKEAYHREAKKNHPDLFPESERSQRELRMMKINEAYIAITSYLSGTRYKRSEIPVREQKVKSESREVGSLKDPAYVYYKRGFKYYTEGYRIFYRRYLKHEQKIRFLFTFDYILKLALSSLQYFEKSYSYFLRVVEDYPESVWTADARMKLGRLETFNKIYQKICSNITEQIRAGKMMPYRKTVSRNVS